MHTVMSPAFLVCAVVTAVSAGVSLGFSLAAARSVQGSARTLALYASVRSLALFAAGLAAFVAGRVGWLEAIAASMIVVQLGDAFVGVTIKDQMKTIGPAITAVLNAAALWWFLA